MRDIVVIGEDILCCTLGEKLIQHSLPDWKLPLEPINKGGITKLLPDLPRYVNLARNRYPVLCIADSDGKCPMNLLNQWQPQQAPESFVFRLAVTEAESWVLADIDGFAEFFKVSRNRIPQNPDQIDKPTRNVLSIISGSKVRSYRKEMISPYDPNRAGPGYNLHLTEFIRSSWRPSEAAKNSLSLHRALARLRSMAEQRPS